MKNIYVLVAILSWLFAGQMRAGATPPHNARYAGRAAAAPVFTFTKTDVTTCNGASTGSISVSASGGAGNYVYSKNNGANFQAGSTFANLAAGTYQIVVQDGSNVQSAAQSVTINQPEALRGGITGVTSTCPGLSTGSLSFSAGGGTAPYQYALNNGTYQSGNVFTGLAGGNYLLSVKDANNCVISPAYYQVTAPTAPTVTPAVTDISCNGRKDGAIRVDLTGGVNQGQATISIDNGATYINNTQFSQLNAGTYKIIVKYANNCLTPVKEATVNQPAPLSFAMAITGTINCHGNETGSISVTASGGTGPYQYSKDGGASFQGNNEFNGLGAGTYRITVIDSKNCTASVQPVTISEPTAITYTIAKTDVSCFGGSNGSITIDAQGGTGPYRYIFSEQGPASIRSPETGTGRSLQAAAGNQYTDLRAKTYYISVIDAEGCYSPAEITVNQPAALARETSVTNALCNGSSTGRITVTATGGTAPYQYSRDNGATFQDNTQFTSLAAGNYSIVVRDKNNCITTAQSVVVTQPAALAFTTNKTDATCAGGNTGSIVITASGGTGPYQYSKDNGSTFQTASTFTGLTAGTYPVLVKDANNCLTAAQSVVIAQPAAITFTATKTDVAACNGDNTGSITVTASGGTGPYQYSKDNGASFQAANQFAALSAGNYPVLIKDVNGCVSAAQSIVITQPPTLAFSTNATNVSCFSGTNGSITFTTSGGTGAYQYSINNGQSFQTSNSFTGLTAGTYQVLVKDANGCLGKTSTVTLTQPTALALTIEQANVSCSGAATGTIVAGGSGGTPVYQYSKDNGTTYQTANQFNGLTAGTYSVRLKDANGCLSATQPVTIAQPTALSLSTAQTNVTTCFGGNNGSITLTATGGTGAYQYSKDNGGSYQSVNTFTGLAAGSYQVLVKDANNCVSTSQNVLITQPTAISFTTVKTDVTSCNGATTGSIVITAGGGTVTYQYSKDNGASFQASNSFTGLGANSYQVVVKDANGCLAPVQTVVINQPSPVEGSVVSVTQTCPGLSTGGLTASASGGTGSYQYALNNGTYQSSNVFTGLGVGDYTLSVKDANGCIYTKATYPITAPTAPTVTPQVTNLTCNGTPNGSINVGTSGGVNVGQIYASINNGATYTNNVQFNNLTAGTYQVLVKYANNCLTSVQSVTVTQPTPVSFSASVTSTIKCYGDITGIITVTATGGITPYQYSKDNGASYQDGNLFGELAAGTYPIVVKDANGCTTPAQQVVLNQPTELTYTVSKTDVSCFGAGNGTITVEAQGGTGPYEYVLNREGLGPMNIGNPGVGTSGSIRNARAAAGKQFTNLAPGTYYVSISDANGCNVRLSMDISQPEALALETSTSSVRCNGGSTGRITVTASGGTGAYQYSKDNGTTYQSTSQFDNVAAGVYQIVVKDANNCVSSAQSITVIQPAVLTASTSKSNVITCFGGNNGSITVTAGGGTAPYQYSKDNGGTFQSGNSFANLTAGTYAIVVKDANGCVTAAQNVRIDQPAVVSFTTTKVNILGCNGDNTGSITVTASGGTGAYQYSKDNGATFQVDNQFAKLPAGSYQVLAKDASGCASAAQTVVLTQPALLTYTTTVTNVSCYGGTNGSIVVTTSGGTAPYQYSGDNGSTFQASNSFMGLGANSYQVVVKDANGCRLEALGITITQPDVLSLSAESINLSCNGAATGSITVTGSGGVPPYQYSKDNGATFQPSNQFAGLTAGTYSVRIKDANGCVSGVRSVSLSQPAALSLSVAKTNITSCNGDATGSITATASGGTGAYQYSKDNGSSFQTTNQFGSLAAGVYSVLAKDANGCLSPAQSVTISQPSTLSLSVIPTDTRCFGDNTGALTITASGGTAPYSYTHDRTEGFQTSNQYENLRAGGYNVRVRDANGCVSGVQLVTINQPQPLTFVTSQTNVTCAGTTTGSIVMTATGGTGAYQYSKDNGATYQPANQFMGLGVGTYSVIVKDANGCVTTAQSITITQPAALAVMASKTDIVSCLDGNTGTISLSATGGTVPYQYSKDNGISYQESPHFAGLSAGAYRLVVNDANGCQTPISVTIMSPCCLSATASPATIAYGQSTTLTATGCSGTINWTGGPQNSNVYVVSPTKTTSYTATCSIPTSGSPITCVSSVTVTVNQPVCTLTTSASPTTITNGQSSTLTASGCEGTVKWTGGPQNSNVYVVNPTQTTSYTATCTLASSGTPITCTSVLTVTVNQPVCALTTSASSATITNGQSSTLTASGCTGTVSWNGGPANSALYVVSPSQSTSYTATCSIATSGSPVTCTSVVTVTVNQPVCALTTSASPTTITNGQSSTLTASGCSGTISWRGVEQAGASIVVSPTQTTSYTATCSIATSGSPVTCTSVVTVTVNQPVCALTTSASPTTITNGQSSTLTASGCSGTISWRGIEQAGASIVVSPSQTTSYTATCSIATSGTPVTCTSVVTVTVNQPICMITAQASSSAVFNGQSTTLTATGCTNGTISWSGSEQTGSTLLVNPTATTTYVVTCTIPTSGSPVICTAPVIVTVVSRPDCNLQVRSNPSTVFAGDPASLTATGCSGTVRWNSGQSGSVITVNPMANTTYDATCTIVTPAGSVSCLATATVTVIDRPVCTLSIQASPTTIFNGQSATLTASGCAGGTVAWDSQPSGVRIIVSPTLTTTYSATCTFTTLAGSVTCTAPVTVSVTQPILQIAGSGAILPLNAVTWAGTVTQNIGPFVWQYKTPAGDWQYFPATFDNNPSILVSATSFLGSVAPVFVNQAIQLRTLSPYLISNVLMVTISQPAPTLASVVTTKAQCASTATGSFTLTAGRNLEPGESAFQARVFAIMDGSEALVASYTFTGTTFTSPAVFGKGTYRVRLQSVIGSVLSAESVQDFTIEDLPVLTLTATKTDILCVGGRNGTINLVAGGGVGPYQFAVNGGAFQSFQAAGEQQIANLAAGTYTIQLRDNNACLAAQPVSVTIAQPTASLTITSGTVKNPTGFQRSDGTITLWVSGGTPDYSFAWSVPNSVTSTQPGGQGVTHTITNLGDGSYTVVVTDKAGCTTQASYSLTQPSSILAKTTIIKAISCARGTDGIVQVDASGGVPKPSGDAYTYDWTVKGTGVSVSKTNRLTNAASVTYTVTITDGNGVAKAFDVYVPEPLPVVVSVASLTNVACFGTATGGAVLSVQGGIAPYVTRWNTQQTGISLVNAQAGRYVAVVTDANACQAQASVQIQQPLALSATLASVSPSCYDICDGRITTTLAGGTAPYLVNWQNLGSPALSLTGLCSGSYTANISDANGCVLTQTTSLTRPLQKQIVLRTNTFICKGQTVDLDATIADGASYVWTYPDGTTRTTPVVSVTSAGNYQVTATDRNGCTVTAQTSLSASDTQAPTLAFAVASQIGVGEPLVAVNITDPRPAQTTWTIPPSASLISRTEDRLEVVFNSTGTYPITMNGVQGQCAFTTVKMVTVVPASTVVNTVQTTPFIQELTILPNPNSGTFRVRIRLSAVSDVKIGIKPLLSTSADIYQQSATGQQEYELSVSIPPQNLQTGNYLLTLETAKAIQTVKLLITL